MVYQQTVHGGQVSLGKANAPYRFVMMQMWIDYGNEFVAAEIVPVDSWEIFLQGNIIKFIRRSQNGKIDWRRL